MPRKMKHHLQKLEDAGLLDHEQDALTYWTSRPYGDIDARKLTRGCGAVHVHQWGVSTDRMMSLCEKLGIPHRRAMVGLAGSREDRWPCFDGVVVLAKDARRLRRALRPMKRAIPPPAGKG